MACYQKPRVLVVDDDLGILDIIQEDLDSQGFSVLIAESADEALNLLEKVDVVVTDIGMPLMSGIEFSKKIHLHYPVVMMSGQVLDDIFDQISDYHDAYIEKLRIKNGLCLAIEKALERWDGSSLNTLKAA